MSSIQGPNWLYQYAASCDMDRDVFLNNISTSVPVKSFSVLQQVEDDNETEVSPGQEKSRKCLTVDEE